jgi:ribosomal protein S19E (S16A)
MGPMKLTQAEQNALERLSKGSDVDQNMWQDLHRKGLVERRENTRALTEDGRIALSFAR